MSAPVTIIIAWTDMSGLKLTGRYLDRYRLVPETKAVEAARAVCWLREGSAEDVIKAQAHCAASIAPDATRSAVYTFDPTERDPLGEAKRRILAG